MWDSEMKWMKRLCDRLSPLCYFWDPRIMDFGAGGVVVVETYPGMTLSIYALDDGSWMGWSLLLDEDGDVVPGGPLPAPLFARARDIDDAVSKIVGVHVQTYRQALSQPVDSTYVAWFGEDRHRTTLQMADQALRQLTLRR